MWNNFYLYQYSNTLVCVSPKCRTDYLQQSIPKGYYCFCQKTIDPRFDPWLLPHSCGLKCEKPLQPVCNHACLLLCHPGKMDGSTFKSHNFNYKLYRTLPTMSSDGYCNLLLQEICSARATLQLSDMVVREEMFKNPIVQRT